MRQATDGSLLFRDLFTTEPHGRMVFLPLFWILGTLARVTGTPILWLWWITNGFAAVLLTIALYRFIAVFLAAPAARLFALALATTASGFGRFVLEHRAFRDHPPIDLWFVEATVFQTLVDSFFTLSLALAFLLLALTEVHRCLESGRVRHGVSAGLWGLALALVHPYDVVILYAVAGSWWALHRGAKRALLVASLIPMPVIAYGVILSRNPTLSQLEWTMPVPSLLAHVLGWGLPLVLAVVAVFIPGARRGMNHAGHLIAWPLIIAALFLLPIEFKRKFVLGLQVPLCILAVGSLAWIRGVLPRGLDRPAVNAMLAVLVILFAAQGSVYWYRQTLDRFTRAGVGEYLPADHRETLQWLRDHLRPTETVMASRALAARIPGATGSTVFAGHWAQTIDAPGKWEFVDAVFSEGLPADGGALRRVLDRNRVRYLVLDARDQGWGVVTPTRPVLVADVIARVVRETERTIVWEVDAYRTRSENEPWQSGDWRGPAGGEP